MKWHFFRGLCAAGLIAGLAACQHAQPAASVRAETGAPESAKPSTYSGNISRIDRAGRIVTVKMLWGRKTFEVPPECEIIARSKPEGALADLQVGDPVQVAYVQSEGLLVARRIAIKGVTPAEKQEAVQEERIEKILTPSPSERPADPTQGR
jgi:hypothetical protein